MISQPENKLTEDSESKLVVSTPFPYCQSVPHLGNISQILKSDIHNKIFNAFYKSGLTTSQSFFSYHFHLTGIPLYAKIQRFRAALVPLVKEYKATKDKVLKKNIKQKVKEVLLSFDLGPLLPKIKNVNQLFTLKNWSNLVIDYYKTLFTYLEVESNLPAFHATTDSDRGYSEFVNLLYNKLKEKNLLVQAQHYLIGCNRCKNILGDHDRVTFEGIGLTHNSFLKGALASGYSFYMKSKEDLIQKFYVFESEKIYLSEAVFLELKKQSLKNSDILFYDKKLQKQYKIEILDPKEAFDLNQIKQVQNLELAEVCYTLKAISCRCSGTAQIIQDLTWFVRYSDLDWKALVEKKIEASLNSPSVKLALINSLKNLRDVAFLRQKGYGTKLKLFRGTSYEKYIVDSLMDSAVHPYYYPSFKGLKNPSEFMQNPDLEFRIHSTGKDLIPTHILFFCCFSALLYPTLEIPYFDCTRFFVAKDMEKMSKSLKNTIDFETVLSHNLSGTGLRAFVATIADNSQPTPIDISLIKIAETSHKKHKAKLLKVLAQNWTKETISVVKQILFEILEIYNLVPALSPKGFNFFNMFNLKDLSLGSKKYYQIRRVYYLIFHELVLKLGKLSILESGVKTVESLDSEEKLCKEAISNLIDVF